MEENKYEVKYLKEQDKWFSKAKKYLDKDKFDELKDKAFNKANANKKNIKEAFAQLKMFIGMVTEFFKKNFPMSNKELLMLISGIVYFVSPIDIIPDFIPVAGLLDDVGVLAFIAKQLSDVMTRYKEMDQQDSDIIDAESEIVEE